MINNFTYNTPTKLIFGSGVIKDLPNVLKEYGKNVLLAYGGGSIKKIGLYDEIKSLLKDFNIVELSGIEPNPKYDPSVLNGVKLCRENKIDVILAVGGGSVLDCAKAISICALYDGEGWDLISGKASPKDNIPLVDILTLAATGSEYDASAVISYTKINDNMMTSVIKSLMVNVKIALEEPDNYSARSELMYAASLACNGILANGTGRSGWPMHSIEHALSAFFDITHGAGLAIITPQWMREILSDNTFNRFKILGKNLFDIEVNNIKDAEVVIDSFYKFFNSLGISMHLADLGVKEESIDAMADHILKYDSTVGSHMYVNLDKDALIRILKASM